MPEGWRSRDHHSCLVIALPRKRFNVFAAETRQYFLEKTVHSDVVGVVKGYLIYCQARRENDQATHEKTT